MDLLWPTGPLREAVLRVQTSAFPRLRRSGRLGPSRTTLCVALSGRVALVVPRTASLTVGSNRHRGVAERLALVHEVVVFTTFARDT